MAGGADEATLQSVFGGGGRVGMLSFPAAIKVYVCTVPSGMRRSFHGLSMMAEHIIRIYPPARRPITAVAQALPLKLYVPPVHASYCRRSGRRRSVLVRGGSL